MVLSKGRVKPGLGESRGWAGECGGHRGLGEQWTSLPSRLRRVEVKKHQPGEASWPGYGALGFQPVGGKGVQAGGHWASLAGLGEIKGSCSSERRLGRMEPGRKLRIVPDGGKC